MKVVISARNFVFDGCGAVRLLEEKGYEVVDVTDCDFKKQDDYFNAIGDADAVINAFEPMGGELISKCKRLKLISVRGVGYDYIDSKACRDNNIAIARTVGTVGAAVSELAMAYMLHFARSVDAQNALMQNGEWKRVMTEGLNKKTVGIIGFGEIGQSLAKKADAFGMEVLYYCKTKKDIKCYNYTPFETLIEESDYIVLALPLTDETRGMIDGRALSRMKKEAVLINVARSGIVDNDALKNAVESGAVRGAAVDVYDSEPCTDSVLRGCKNIILTPHTAPFTKNNFIDMNMLCAKNIIDFFEGTIDKKYLV